MRTPPNPGCLTVNPFLSGPDFRRQSLFFVCQYIRDSYIYSHCFADNVKCGEKTMRLHEGALLGGTTNFLLEIFFSFFLIWKMSVYLSDRSVHMQREYVAPFQIHSLPTNLLFCPIHQFNYVKSY